MKADTPRAPIAKYGMIAEYSDRIVQRHFEVLDEEEAIHIASMAHNTLIGPAISATLNRAGPTSTPNHVAPAPLLSAAVSVEAQDWRARLGLR